MTGKWDDAERKALEKLQANLAADKAADREREHKETYIGGCGTGILLVVVNVAVWWWAVARIAALLRG